MTNFERLCAATRTEQAEMLRAPIIADVALGRVDVPMYVAFLTNAYHHVRHTVPLMMAVGARMGARRASLLADLRDYIVEEIGHEQWILDDLAACGADPAEIARSRPNLATEVLVSYVRDYVNAVHPAGFFGMVHVLEGTSTSLATPTADLIQKHLHLPDAAFGYLRSHGCLDVEHVDFFRHLLERLDSDEVDHAIHVAGRVFQLYGAVLRSVPRIETAGHGRHVA